MGFLIPRIPARRAQAQSVFVAGWLAISALATGAHAQPAAATATAKDKDLAKEWARKGRERFDQGHYAGAIEALREAEKHYAAATIVKLRGDAHEKLGQLIEARDAYRAVATEALGPDATAPILAAQKAAQEALAEVERRIPTVEISLPKSLSGASLKVDGVVVSGAELSRPLPLNPGKHLLLVESPGSEPRIREVQLAEGAHERVSFGPAGPANPAGGGGGGEGGSAPSGAGRSWVGPGIAFGVGGAALVAGAVTGILTITKMDEIRKTCGDALLCPEAQRGEVDGARTLGHVSTAMFVAAGVGVAAGVVLVLIPQKAAPKAAQITVSPGYIGVKGAF